MIKRSRIIKKLFLVITLLLVVIISISCKTKDCTYYKNEKYGSFKRQKYDLYLPNDMKGTKDGGLVLYIHGGAWVAGDKDGYRSEMEKNAKEGGYAYAAMNYHYISDDSDCFVIMNDVFMALDAIKKKAKENDIELTKVLLTGGSAGAHIALLYAYAYSQIEPFYSPIVPTCVVSYSGPAHIINKDYYQMEALSGQAYDLFSKLSGFRYTEETYEDAIPYLLKVSPTYYASHAVPTVICHGEKDTVVPVTDAYTLDNFLTSHYIPHDLIIFPNSNHGLESDPDKWEEANNLFKEYMEKYL